MSDQFSLMVHVEADEWAYMQRRQKFLESVLVQILRDRDRLQEWYSAPELVALRLPGLPLRAGSITAHARRMNWARRTRTSAQYFEYHFISLPARAFDALIERIIMQHEPVPEDTVIPEIATPEYLPDESEDIVRHNTAPPWVLPFMRLMKGDAAGNISKAWQYLPEYLPEGMVMPSKTEVAETLLRFNLVK